ncbi:LLM class flavin-dependent oxidoreductase [Dermatobacter hominis]|uniref:LLM class flavin-dependent oxidoreductase n=1 Tax=Dermatobacter hominis TaxID=2884263 RepID=UPI0035ABD5D9
MRWPGAEVGALAEAAGCSAFCTGEFVDGNAYVTLAEMAANTSSARIGTGVAYAFARSPFVHASAMRHVDKLAPGRTFLGLGAGTRRMNEDWFAVPADRPLARMADMVGAVRAYLRAPNRRPVRHDGEFYPIDATIMAPVLGPIDVPIVVGAFNRGMLEVAGRVADGIIGHGLFTDRWWDEVVDPHLAAGASSAGRDAGSLQRWGWVITSVDDADPARAERDARLMVGFYVTVKTYDTLTSMHGWDDAVRAVREAFRAGDMDAMADAIPVDMLDAIAVYGTAAEARDRLAARRRLPDLRFHSVPSFMVSPRRATAYAEAIVELVGDGAASAAGATATGGRS